MKISFLASHGGSSAKYIITAIQENRLISQIGIIITNNGDSEIYKWAKKNKFEVILINKTTHPVLDQKDQAIQKNLSLAGTDLIILSGYMQKIGKITLAAYPNKILNIHPSLLPKHGGKGLYGDKVHKSVIKAGDKVSGVSVHFINEEYDEGEIILQKLVAVVANETVQSLKNKIKAVEGEIYLDSIKKIIYT